MQEGSARLDVTVGDAPRSFRLSGDIDSHTATALESRLEEVGTDGDVLLDLSGVGFIDSSGLRVLMAAHQRLDGAGRQLTLQSPSEAVIRLIEITGLREHLHIA